MLDKPASSVSHIIKVSNNQPLHVFMSPTNSPPSSEQEICGNRTCCIRAKLAMPGYLLGTFGLLLSLLIAPVHATVFKWTDSSGHVHYTDQWRQGAQPVDLPEPSVYTPPPVPSPKQSPAAEAKDGLVGSDYDLLEVSAPTEGETIRNNEGKVSISLRLEPTLRQGDVIELFLDGAKIDQEFRVTGATLFNLDRGSHSLKARVVNDSGQELISSQPVVFHLRRESKLFPNKPKPVPLPSAKP